MTAGELVDLVVDRLERLVAAHLPGLRVPGIFAGHRVEPDVRADLAFTIAHLHDAGVTRIAGTDVVDALATVLGPIDGERTNTFFSYRVAETLARFGPPDDNAILARLGDEQRAQVLLAVDSTASIPALQAGQLPRNYAAVLTRCELGRAALGLVAADDPGVASLLELTRALLAEDPNGFLDDSHTAIGRYDIYTADIYLFTEPFAATLGDRWDRGAANAVRLGEAVATPDGTLVPWGRSTGALGACHAVELAALVAAGRIPGDAGVWSSLAAAATEACRTLWFASADGLVTAHQHRSPYGYRGTHRRLQMTLDCLGKLAAAATAAGAGSPPAGSPPAGPPLSAPSRSRATTPVAGAERDELVVLGTAGAGVWSYRSDRLSFVVPFVGATVSDYLPAPRHPGVFETPVDADLPCWTPLVVRGNHRYTAGMVPAWITHEPGQVTARYEGFAPSYRFEAPDPAHVLPGSRTVRITAAGRGITIDEQLTFDEGRLPDAIAITIPETGDRPLAVRWHDGPGTPATIDTSGLKEWRSFWGELPTVHQLDIDPTPTVAVTYTVTPAIRVLSTSHRHHYEEVVWTGHGDLVRRRPLPLGRLARPRSRADDLRTADAVHLHWPEWLGTHDPAVHHDLIATLAEHGVPIVWTMHNLRPHDRAVGDELYHQWAAAAAAVIHHSETGRKLATERYAFAPGCRHEVIAHPHFGPLVTDLIGPTAVDRAAVEAELGLRVGVPLRIGVVGAPRADKDVGMVMAAVAACERDDIELAVWSLRPGEQAPDDERIVAHVYVGVDRATYNQRLAVCDVLVLPFDPEGEMLATGTVAEALALGIPCIATDWWYLVEVLGDAAITYDGTVDDLVSVIEELRGPDLRDAAWRMRRRAAAAAPARIAARTYALFDDVCAVPGRGGVRG